MKILLKSSLEIAKKLEDMKLNILKDKIFSNKLIQFFVLPILVMGILLYLVLCRIGGEMGVPISYVLVSLLFVIPIAHLLCCIKNRLLYTILLLLFLFVSLVETSMVVTSQNFISAGNILATLNTNRVDSWGFIKNNINVIFYYIPLLGLSIIAYLVWNIDAQKVRWHGIAFICSFLLFWGYVCYKYFVQYKEDYTFKYLIEQVMLHRVLYNFFNQSTKAFKWLQRRDLITKGETVTYGATCTTITKGKEVYVLAIGESVRYENFSMNGTYHRETTPLLSAMPNAVLMSDYYSTATLTMYSVPQILTRATADDFYRNYTEASISLAFDECGFESFIIANKKKLLSYENYLARGAEILIVENDFEIPTVIDSLIDMENKLFIITQFWGSHNPYIYPEEFNIYIPNEKSNWSESTKEYYINGYDNYIQYADFVISKMIRSVDQPNIISGLIYVSDHGENFTDKGGLHGTSYNPPKTEYHVPLVVWNSDEWIDNNEIKWENLNKNSNAPLNADNLFYTICDMANIHIPHDEEIVKTMSIYSNYIAAS